MSCFLITITKKKEKGLTLIEVMISLFIILLISVSIFSIIIFSLKITSDNKMQVEAISIGNQKMEQILNLPYSQIGLIDGDPIGVLQSHEEIERQGAFDIETSVKFFDDPYDDEAFSGDLTPNDYKIVSLKIIWKSKFGEKSITFISKIIPNSLEA